MFGHAMMCNWFGPEFSITEAEALELSRAYAGWRQHYGGVFDPKTEALMTLLGVAAAIEGPRVMRISARKKAIKRQAQEAAEAHKRSTAPNVVPIGG
jgi:hypothetical protein